MSLTKSDIRRIAAVRLLPEHADPSQPLDRASYEALGVMPFDNFSVEKQAAINEACTLDVPPPYWHRSEMFSAPRRDHYEWYWRRGRDPSAKRTSISTGIRQLVVDRHGMVCWLCAGGIADSDLHLDHVIPWSHGGSDSADNLRPAHSFCNTSRGNRTVAP